MSPAARKPAPAKKKSATKKQPVDAKRPMPKKAAAPSRAAAKASKPAKSAAPKGAAKATTKKKNPRTMDETNVKAPAAASKAAGKATARKTAAPKVAVKKAAAKATAKKAPAAPKAARKATAKAATKPAAKKAAPRLAPKPTAKAPKPAAKAPKAAKAAKAAPKPAAKTAAKAKAAPSGRDAVAAILKGKAPRPAARKGAAAAAPAKAKGKAKAKTRAKGRAAKKPSRGELLQKLLSLRAKETARTGHKAAADMRKGLPSRVPTSVAKAAEFAETRKISSMVSSAPADQEPEPTPKKKPARRRKAPYTKTELRELREILETERVRLLKDMDVLDARKAEAEASNRTFSNHQADAATDSSAMETMFVTRRYEEERLGQVVTALERLDKGDYGLCDMCADEPQKLCESCPFIPIGRLRAKPFAKLCVPCREQMEKAKRR